MLSDGTVQNDRHAKPNRESGSQVQLPEQTHRYLTTENALPPCYFHDDVYHSSKSIHFFSSVAVNAHRFITLTNY